MKQRAIKISSYYNKNSAFAFFKVMTSFSLYCDWCSNIALGYLRTNRCLHWFRFVEFWVQGGPANHMWGVLVYIHVGSIYIILVIPVIIVIEMVKDGRLKWTDCRPSLALSKWYRKNRAKYTCIRFARLTMLQIYAKAGQLLDPSFLCPYDQCSRYMQN